MENTTSKVKTKNRKPLNREAKVVIAVSSSLLIIALIIAVIFAAINSVTGIATVWSRTFSDVGVFVVDDVFVAREGENWVFVKDDRVISKRYADLEYSHDNVYIYTTKEGKRGFVDTRLNETHGYYTNNNLLTDKDFKFYIVRQNGKDILYSDNEKVWDNGADKIYPYADFEAECDIEALPNDIIYYQQGADFFLTRVNLADKAIKVTGKNLVFTQKHVSVGDGNSWISYKLSDLTPDSQLGGANPQNKADGNLFKTINGKTLVYNINAGVLTAQGYVGTVNYVSKLELIAGGNGNFLAETNAGFVYFQDGALKVFINNGKITLNNHTVYNLDGTLVSQTGEKLMENVRSVKAENDKFAMVTLKDGTVKLYEFDGAKFKIVNENYGGSSDNKRLLGGEVYTKNGNKVLGGKNITSLVTDRVFLSADGGYYNERGKRVEDVIEILECYNFSHDSFSRYIVDKGTRLFVNEKNELVDFSGVVVSNYNETVTKLGNFITAVEMREGYMLSFKYGYYFSEAQKTIQGADVSLINESIVAVCDGGSIKTFKGYKRSFSHVETIAGKGLKIYDANKYGTVFVDANGKYGAINSDGKMVLSARFEKVEYFKEGIIATYNDRCAMFSLSGKQQTDYIYAPQYILIEDLVLMQNINPAFFADNNIKGGYVLVNSSGKEITKPAFKVEPLGSYTIKNGYFEQDSNPDSFYFALYTESGTKICQARV